MEHVSGYTLSFLYGRSFLAPTQKAKKSPGKPGLLFKKI
jgi:hypothetical protein